MAGLQSSTGELLESRRIWSTHRARGLPGRRLQSGPGGRPTDKSMFLRHVRRNISLKPGNVLKNRDSTSHQDFTQWRPVYVPARQVLTKAHRPQLKAAKTEVLWCASSRQHQIPTGPVRVGDALVSPVTAARDLGVYIDADVTMRTHVTNTVRACPSARSADTDRTLVITQLDQCNSVLVGTSVYL